MSKHMQHLPYSFLFYNTVNYIIGLNCDFSEKYSMPPLTSTSTANKGSQFLLPISQNPKHWFKCFSGGVK